MIVERGRIAAALPAYELGPELGSGSFGLVLAARHRKIERDVAVKIIPVQGDRPSADFAAEARVLASLDHPHLVRLYDYDERDGLCLLVMELLPGSTLNQRKSLLTALDACAAGLALAAGLENAHAHGVLHRDIKPDNAIFDADGLLKLTDFGIAKLFDGSAATASAVAGTPTYMAPEQIRTGRLTPATDIYALGVVLYELLAGSPPFSSSAPIINLYHQHLWAPPPPLSMVPPDIGDVVLRALAKEPEDRFPSAGAFAAALAGAATATFGPGWLGRTWLTLRLPDEVRATCERAEPPRPADASPPPPPPPASPPPAGGPGPQPAAGARNAARGRRASSRRRRLRLLAAATVLLTAAGVSLLLLLGGGPGGLGGGCSGRTVLRVAADPGPARPLTAIAADYNRSKPSVDGHCVTVAVSALTSRAALTALAGRWSADGAGPEPDVWVPESADWSALARTVPAAAGLLAKEQTTIATTPVVVAMPAPLAAAFTAPGKPPLTWRDLQDDVTNTSFWSDYGHPEWGGFRVEFADASASDATLRTVLSMATVRQTTGVSALTPTSFRKDRTAQLSVLVLERNSARIPKTTGDLFADLRAADTAGKSLTHASAIPMLESDVVAYNGGVGSTAGAPRVQLTAVYPGPTATRVDVTYITAGAARTDRNLAGAAAAFLARVRSDAGQREFSSDGYRGADGSATALGPGTGSGPATSTAVAGPVLSAATTFFTAVHQRGASLALLDMSGSMNEIVAGTNPPQTKAQVAANALVTALPLFAPDSAAGLWVFSTELDNGQYTKELFPVEDMDAPGRPGPTHRDDLRDLGAALRPAGDTPLYAAVLAAFRDRAAHYVNGRLNLIFVLTDGRNDTPGDPRGIDLDQLLRDVRAEFDPKRPVRLVTIAYGPDADPAPLREIAAATGAPSYQSRDPTDIFNVFVDALTEIT